MTNPKAEYLAWIKYADDDLLAAEQLTKVGLYNLVCFHSHQAAEKSLKAFLVDKGINPPRIHNLIGLLNICAEKELSFKELKQEVLALDMYYIPTRYPNAPVGSLPDGLPNEKDAQNALKLARKIRGRIQK